MNASGFSHSRASEVAVNESATSAGADGVPTSAVDHQTHSIKLLRYVFYNRPTIDMVQCVLDIRGEVNCERKRENTNRESI